MDYNFYYQKIMDDLREKIMTGEYKKGEFIPSESRLQEQYGMSRTTVRTAVQALVDEGILQIVRGKGTRVSLSALHSAPGSMFSVCEEIRARGMSVSIRKVEIVEMEASEYISGKLGIQPGEPIWRIFRLICADGEPFSQNYSFLPAKLLAGWTKEAVMEFLYQSGSSYQFLEDKLDVRIVIVNDAISAINGDDNNVHLNQKEGDAVLRIERVGYDKDNTPMEYAQIYIRGDRFTQHVTIQRK